MSQQEMCGVRFLAALAILFSGLSLFLLSPRALAADPPSITIPAGDLNSALKTLVQQTGVQLLYDRKTVEGIKTKGAKAAKTAEEAIGQLLEGTKLTTRKDVSGAILISAPTQSRSTSGTRGGSTEESPQGRRLLAQAGAASPSPGSGGSGPESKDSSHSDSSQTGEESTKGIPEILVLGSPLLNVDIKRSRDDVQPYYILDSALIEQSGAADVEEFLKQRLTMNTTIQSNSQAYPAFSLAGATSTINLRGLGPNETLILINGRRSAGVSIQGVANQPDINSIPLSAIERIEVLPSSASAIYGGAAVGGVVNVILKKNFSGGELNAGYESPTRSHAPTRFMDATYGFSLGEGRTQIMLAGHYADADPLTAQDRPDLTVRGISTILSNSPSYFFGPTTPFPGATTNIVGVSPSGSPTNLVLKNGTPLNSSITSITAGAAPGSDISAGLLANAGRFNFNLAPLPTKYGLQGELGTAPRNKALMATVRQELTAGIEAFTEFAVQSNASRSLIDPFSSVGFPIRIPATAPSNPFQENVVISVPAALAMPDTTNSVTHSLSTGVVAHLPKDWMSEFDYTWSRNEFHTSFFGYDLTSFNSALATGALNPFVDTVAHPLGLAPYLVPSDYSGSSTLNDFGLRASGPVGSLPAGRPTLTVGLEHRKESSSNADYFRTFLLTPAASTHVRYFGQSQSTDSLYAEAQIPIVGPSQALPWLRSLDAQLAGRTERYTVDAGTPFVFLAPAAAMASSPPQGVHSTVKYTSTNPTIGLKYRPFTSLTLRASFAKAFLPPTFAQLLPSPVPDRAGPYISINDPQTGQSYLVNTTSGGNPNLKPQTANSWDFGMIWEPDDELLEGLRVDLEYYRIAQPDYITAPSPQQVISNPAYASRLTRDPTTGRITLVDVSFLNAAEYRTDGWDLTLNYHKATAIGAFDFYALGTYVAHDKRQYAIGSPFLDYAGYPADGGEDKTKANTALSWEYANVRLTWSSTYYGSYHQYNSVGSPLYLQFGPFPAIVNAQGGNSIDSQIYHDIFATYTLGKLPMIPVSLKIAVGLKNVFNTRPPFDAFYNPYYYSPYGDPRLREYQIRASMSF